MKIADYCLYDLLHDDCQESIPGLSHNITVQQGSFLTMIWRESCNFPGFQLGETACRSAAQANAEGQESPWLKFMENKGRSLMKWSENFPAEPLVVLLFDKKGLLYSQYIALFHILAPCPMNKILSFVNGSFYYIINKKYGGEKIPTIVHFEIPTNDLERAK